MKIHRFYIEDFDLTKNIWIHQPNLIHQWVNVLRFKVGQDLVLFDGVENEKLYKIVEVKKDEVNLEFVTDFHRNLPKKDIYLFWSLLKKDKNSWILQKCTELGVTHFIPILADRSEKTGFKIDRYKKIIIEAVEQCGRSDIPKLREPLSLESAINQYQTKVKLHFAEQSDDQETANNADPEQMASLGIIVGPEGGWTEAELSLFDNQKVKKLNLHDFTLRAETASLVSVSKLLQ